MNKNVKRNLVKDVLRIGKQGSTHSLGEYEEGLSWSCEDGVFSLYGAQAYEYLALVGDLARKQPWSDHFSEEYLKDRLVPSLKAAARDERNKLEDLIDELISDVENYSSELKVLIPVSKLTLKIDSLQVGRVTLWARLHKLDLERLHDIPTDDADAATAEQAESKQLSALKRIKDDVMAEVRVVAEPTRAREIAEQETQRAIEIINFSNAALYHWTYQAESYAEMYEESGRAVELCFISSGESLTENLRRKPSTWPITVSAQVLDRFEDVGFSELSRILTQSPKTLSTLEDSILIAVHWFAASQTQSEIENRLLNLITCLESLVGPKGGTAISSSVAEATALIVGESLDERVRIKRFVSDSYNARSKISHGGSKEVSTAQVAELRSICSRVITQILRWNARLGSRDELHSWLERLRLSGEGQEPPPGRGKPRSIRQARVEKAWSLEELSNACGIRRELLAYLESSNTAPDLGDLRKLANALQQPRDAFVLPPTHRIIEVRQHWFMLSATQVRPGLWNGCVIGWDFGDAPESEMPTGLLDPSDPNSSSPTIMMSKAWHSSGFSVSNALTNLEARVRTAIDHWLSSPKDKETSSTTSYE